MSFFSDALKAVTDPTVPSFVIPIRKATGKDWRFSSMDEFNAFIKTCVLSNQGENGIEYRFFYRTPFAPLGGGTDITLPGWFNFLQLTSTEDMDVLIHLELVHAVNTR